MKNEFGLLKRKMLQSVLLTVIIALLAGFLIMVLFIDGIFQDPFADFFVTTLGQRILNMNYESALALYHNLFRDNKSLWISIGFFITLLVIFYVVLSRFTRYFREITSGIDKLVEESEGEILLSPELGFIEKKLNTVKNSLKKRSQDALQAEQRKNDLVVYLAHDIKTPLTSVIGYLCLLDEAKDLPQEQKDKYVALTLNKAYRLEQLINEFFEITRFNLQTIVLNKEEINLTLMLLQMADEFYPILSPLRKQIIVKADDGLTLQADPDKMARVFNNILKNAIAYSYPDTTIEMTAEKLENNVSIQFMDYGRTIPENKLNTIFEKFYRLDTSRSTETGGAGLGLAIAKEIVTAHNGSITVTSENECTRFTVTLPA